MLPAPQTAPSTRAQDREQIRRRRELVYKWRRVEGLSFAAISARLARLTPPIQVHPSQVTRDVAHMDRQARTSFDRTQFDPVGFIIQQRHRFESLYAKAIRDAHRTRSALERAACYRVASHVLEQITALMQDTGLVDRNLGTLLLAAKDGAKIERTPSGLEMQRIFDGVVITDEELISDAERSYLGYGDSEALHRERERKAGR